MSSVRRLTSLENRSAVVLVEMYDGCHNNGYKHTTVSSVNTRSTPRIWARGDTRSVQPHALGLVGSRSTSRNWAREDSFNPAQLGSWGHFVSVVSGHR